MFEHSGTRYTKCSNVKNKTLGKIYSTTTILAPDFGLKEQEKEYLGETIDQSQNYKRIYRESLERQLVQYQSQNPANLLSQTEAISRKRKRTKKKDPFTLTRDTSSPSEDELTRHFASRRITLDNFQHLLKSPRTILLFLLAEQV
ncbi:hypothetical protein N7495_007419 [Penicillium taxi]|uniref:uncharacterized protein n=1 Tax=Penicillium taxi TaxID=168475 RepID=UPI0025454739|nr:uncharacterized protein N7495_007419 [Penicillium taxi]KAJ5887378.1 hypothetical protein N7495_007419 [Penicillium taxi]